MSDQKIQYKLLRKKPIGMFNSKFDFEELETELNKLGQEGWDLVTTLEANINNTRTTDIVLLLKKYIH